MAKTFKELDEQRITLGTMSRAELARRAGIAESTFTKGVSGDRKPQTRVRRQIELVLEAERIAIEGGLREGEVAPEPAE